MSTASGRQENRRAQFFLSGGGQNGSAQSEFMQRVVVRLPVTTTRWRIRMVNQTAGGTANPGATTITSLWMGAPNPSASNPGKWDGTFAAAPAQALSSFTLDPAGQSATVTPWVTSRTLQFSADTTTLLSVGMLTSAANVALGCGSMWFTFGAGVSALASAQSPGLFFSANIWLTWAIEYEWTGTESVGLAIGDSLTEGWYGSNAASNPLDMTGVWHQVASARTGLPICASGYFGSTTATWAGGSAMSAPMWTGITAAGLNVDFAIPALGTNDAFASVSLATFQANLATIIGRLRTTFGIRKIYLPTIAPRSLTGTPETLRQSYNAWLRTCPFDAAGVLDWDQALAASWAGSTAVSGALDTDNIHQTPLGARLVGNASALLKVT